MILINAFDVYTQIPSILDLGLDRAPDNFVPVVFSSGQTVYIDEEASNPDLLWDFNVRLGDLARSVQPQDLALLYVLYDEYLQSTDMYYETSHFKHHLDALVYIPPTLLDPHIMERFPRDFTEALVRRQATRSRMFVADLGYHVE